MAQQASVIIIGAGLAGLAAGCYAQMNGLQSQVFEHHSLPGGVAAAWRRQGYLIDGGIHFIMGHKPGSQLFQVFRELGVTDPALYTEMGSYGRFIHQAAGIELTVGRDLDQLAAELKRLSPPDSRIIDDLFKAARALRGRDLSTIGMNRPPELTSYLDRVRDLWQMRSMLRYFAGRYNRKISDLAREVETPWLRDFFTSLFLPESPVWFILMLLALVADGQCALPIQGCLEFVLAIERRYKSLRGRATYRATVDKIIVENDRAVGVRLSDGREYRAEYVISSGDSYNTIFNLLDGRYINDRVKKRHADWPLSRPFLLASFGVKRDFAGQEPFSTLVLKDPIKIGDEQVSGLFLRILNYGPGFAPAGKSLLQVEIESDFDYWFDLQGRDRPAYEAEKKRVAAEFLSRLEKYYPGLTSQVEMMDVATPYTTWRYTLNRQGAWGAWLMTPEIITRPIERKLPGLKNCYLAGQWVMCGGVPPSLYSGRHAVQLICRDGGRKFVTTV